MKSVAIAFNYVDFSDPKKKRRQEVAMDLLCRSPENIFPVAYTFLGDIYHDFGRIISYNILERNSAHTINNDRELPYVKEILDDCAHHVPCPQKFPDVIGVINSDILLGQSFYDTIQSDTSAFVLSRYEITDVDADSFLDGKFKVIYGGDSHPGADGFFFNRNWWIENENRFPKDCIMGETEWDTIYRSIIRKYAKNHIEKRVLYHQYHDAKWKLDSPGAKNNIAIWEKIKRKCG